MLSEHSIETYLTPFDVNCQTLQRALSKYHNAWLYPHVKNYREDRARDVVEAARFLLDRLDREELSGNSGAET